MCEKERPKAFSEAEGVDNAAGGLGDAVSPPTGPGQRPVGGPGDEATGSSMNLHLKGTYFCLKYNTKPAQSRQNLSAF